MKDSEIKKQIDRIIILIDSREKLPNHITKAFDKYGVYFTCSHENMVTELESG